MKVIMAGMPKTGTKSMVEALSILGYNVHDTMQHYRQHRQVWYDFLGGKASIEDIRQSYDGVDAVTDIPVYHFWEQLLEAFPDSKIILTTRNEDGWVKSVQGQLKAWQDNTFVCFLMVLSPTGWSFFRFLSDFFIVIFGYGPTTPFSSWRMSNNNILVKFREHNSYVLTKTSKEQMLAYDVKDGWEPLCKFLGKDIPNQPFPRMNVGGSIVKERTKADPTFQRMKYESLISISIIILALSVLLYYFL